MGKGSAPTIGYRHKLGVHFVLCLGPADFIKRIDVNEEQLAIGDYTDGIININEPDLFGGDEREGGVTGNLEIQMGGPAQAPSSYLAGVLGDIPAFRGVVSAILRQMNIGNNPYLKPWAFQVQRILATDPGYNGGTQWEPEIAPIPRGVRNTHTTIFIAYDVSSDPLWFLSGFASIRAYNSGAVGLANGVTDWRLAEEGGEIDLDIKFVKFGGDAITESEEFRNITGSSDWTTLQNFCLFTSSSTTEANWGVGLSEAADWFAGAPVGSRKVLLVFASAHSNNATIAAGQTIIDSLTDIDEIQVFQLEAPSPEFVQGGITAWDNTIDGSTLCFFTDYPDNTSVSPQNVNAGLFTLDGIADMNPAHILREVLVSPDTGGSGDDSIIGPSFELAAGTLYAENFGLSMKWNTPSRRIEFIKEVENHIDAKVYQNRRTGQWELKLIRDDYDVEDLPLFDTSNVISWGSPARPEPQTLPNQVVVVWTDEDKEEPGSLTLTNAARALFSGRVISEKREYRGIFRADLASRVASRDLGALSSPLLTGSFVATYVPLDINLGSPIIIHNPRLGIENVIVRVTELVEGEATDNGITIRYIEDKFSLDDEVQVVIEPYVPPIQLPYPVDLRMVEETPYYALGFLEGQTNVDTNLISFPDLGTVHVAGGQPTLARALNVRAVSDDGTGYERFATMDFAAASQTLSPLGIQADQTILITTLNQATLDLSPGEIGWLNGEYVVLVSATAGGTWDPGDYWVPTVDPPTVDYMTVVVGRACLDTRPEFHEAGEALIFWRNYNEVDPTPYTDGESIDVRLITLATGGALAAGSAPVDTVVMDARAIRPYPPGNLRVDGTFEPGDWVGDYREITWAHRNRLTQTTGIFDDHLEGDIGPEMGVTYRLDVWGLDADGERQGAVLYTESGITDTSRTLDTTTITTVAGQKQVEVAVTSVRDGLDSWKSPRLIFNVVFFRLKLSGDQQTGTDVLLLSGDEQTGTDALNLSGDANA